MLNYDLRYGPLRLLEVRATVDLDEVRYQAVTEMRTVGLIGALFPWAASSRSMGVQTPDGARPEWHRSTGTFRGQTRSVEIDYGADGAATIRIEPPPESDWREPVPPILQVGTIDPLSASLGLYTRQCAGTIRVFDGRRRYDLHLTDMGPAEVPTGSTDMVVGPARRCRAVVQALAGFWRTDGRHTEMPTALDVWLVTPVTAARPIPCYLELSGRAAPSAST